MEMLGAITGLIGAGLQAQAQADQLQFQYAHFNWEKQRANTQDRFAQASRSDQYGNVTGYDPILNKWDVKLAPTQKEISDAGQKEQLLQLTKDIPAARKIKEAVQQRAYDAKEPFLRASLGYQYDQPPSEDSIRSKLTELMASNEMIKSKADQALLMRQAARMGHGAKAADIINANDLALGNEQRVKDKMLQARTDAMKEFAARTSLHERMSAGQAPWKCGALSWLRAATFRRSRSQVRPTRPGHNNRQCSVRLTKALRTLARHLIRSRVQPVSRPI